MNQTEVTQMIAEYLGSSLAEVRIDDVSIVRSIADPSCPQSDVILVSTPDAVLSVTVEILDQS